MNRENDSIARQIFQDRLKMGLLGPGSDVFVFANETNEEIISSYPLQRYYTGILFPEKELLSSYSELLEAETETGDEDIDDIEQNTVAGTEIDGQNIKEENSDDELRISQNTFFPTNIGLTFCTDDKVKEIDVEFNFGLYSQIEKEMRIQISETDFNEFVNNPAFPFKDLIRHENGYMVLSRKLKGKSRSPRTEEFALNDNFKKLDSFKDSPIKYVFHYFEKLIGRTWKRKNISINKTIRINEITKPEIIFEKNITKTKKNFLKIGYTVKTYKISENPNNTYIKIQFRLSGSHFLRKLYPEILDSMNVIS
jgi:hypothetical protein